MRANARQVRIALNAPQRVQVFALACDRMRSTCANACKRVCARSDALKASEAHNMCARERGSRTHANIYTVQFYAHHNNNTRSLGCGCCKMQHAQPQMPCFAIVACMFCDRGVTQGWQKYVTHVACVAIRCVGVTHSVCHTHTQHTPTHTHTNVQYLMASATSTSLYLVYTRTYT
jgi:hypothetical protein